MEQKPNRTAVSLRSARERCAADGAHVRVTAVFASRRRLAIILRHHYGDGSSMTDNSELPRRAEIPFRLDLIQEVISADEETHTVRMRVTPNPRRYQRIEREGGTWYRDRYFDHIFRLEDFANGLEGVPIFASNRTIESASDYAGERLVAVGQEFQTGEYSAPTQSARPHTPFADLTSDRNIAFMSVDICGSTALRQLDRDGFETAYTLLLRELGTAVGQFEGTLLKATGDGFIAYVDLPSFNVMADNIVDLGGTMLQILHRAVNPNLQSAGVKPLSIRVGADYGPARIREIAVPVTGFIEREVTSDALNRAVKIEQSCDPDTFRVGYDLYQILHVQWLERCTEVHYDGNQIGIKGYRVFEVT